MTTDNQQQHLEDAANLDALITQMEGIVAGVYEVLTWLGESVATVVAHKEVMTLDDFRKYVGITKSYAYRLTSEGRVPHYKPHGKKLYFKKAEIDRWLTQEPIGSKAAPTQAAAVQAGGEKHEH